MVNLWIVENKDIIMIIILIRPQVFYHLTQVIRIYTWINVSSQNNLVTYETISSYSTKYRYVLSSPFKILNFLLIFKLPLSLRSTLMSETAFINKYKFMMMIAKCQIFLGKFKSILDRFSSTRPSIKLLN